MATSPIYSWPEPDNTDLVKNGALAIRTLGNAIDTTMGTMVAKTIIDAKGDLIAGTAADTAARLAVGNNGETLVADSTTATGLRYQGLMAAGKNMVINGAMQIWQRGTSFTSNSSVTNYTADRFVGQSNATTTFSRQVTGDTTNLPFIQYCLRAQRNSGATGTDFINIAYSAESADSIPFAGKTVTMSFYARKGANFSDGTSALVVQLLSGTGTDQNSLSGYTGSATVASISPTLTTTWQRFSVTGSVAATATEIGINAYHRGAGTAGAADYWELTGVQIELGSVATSFDTATGTIQGELAACQRYYQKTNNQSENPGTAPTSTPINAINASTTIVVGIPPFKVSMRVAPTVTLYSSVTGTTGKIRSGGADVTASVADVGEYTIGYISATGLVPASNSTIAFAASAEL